MDELTRKRLEHNEVVFRAVNEEIDDLPSHAPSRSYICECADISCSETISLTHAEYQRIRSRPDQYVLVPGHEVPGLEDVVEFAPGHVVVDKH